MDLALLLLPGWLGCAPTGIASSTEETEPVVHDSADVEGLGEVCPDLDHPDLVVNEVVTANVRGLLDEEGQSLDWIEVLNRGQVPVDLGGWGLSDDAEGRAAWTFPEGALAPGEVLVVWAAGREVEGDLYAPFGLSATGDAVVLTAPDGCVVDEVETPRLYRDVAWGRTEADSDRWAYFLEPTPGAPNTTESRPGFAEVPALSPDPGFSTDAVTVVVESTADAVRVTLDGSAPDERDDLYEGPFEVQARPDFAVVRARAYEEGLWPSRVATSTWSQDPGVLDAGLKIVSLVVDPYDLYDEETGIAAYGPPDYTPGYPYFGANFWEDWERDLHITVFDTDGEVVIDQDAGIKVHGGYTRAFEQKNWRVIPRGAYGPETLDHKFFPNMAQTSFDVMVLEGAGDWCPTHTENSLVDQLFRDAEGVRLPWIDSQAWEPTVVYLNGEFWGLYSFREKLDEHYIARHHGADRDNLDRIECTADGTSDWWRVNQGDWERFDELNAFVASHDLSDAEAWETFTSMIDVENMATSILAVGFMANRDWWANNLKLWRERVDPGPFRHMVFDLGHGWGTATYDHFGYSVGFSGPGLPIADALENEAFRVLLANQASDYLNTVMSAEHALSVLDGMHARIEPVIEDQYALWCGAPVSSWYASVDYARDFVQARPDAVWGHVRRGLGLDGLADLSLDVEPEGAGSFQLTAVEVEPPFSGRFWTGIPVTVTAHAGAGWTFVGWSDGASEPKRTLTLSSAQELVARFE